MMIQVLAIPVRPLRTSSLLMKSATKAPTMIENKYLANAAELVQAIVMPSRLYTRNQYASKHLAGRMTLCFRQNHQTGPAS